MNTMGYINYSFLIRLAMFGSIFSLLPVPVLAKVSSDDASSRLSTAPFVSISDDEAANHIDTGFVKTSNIFMPAVIASAEASRLLGSDVVDLGLSLPTELTQISQLPNLPEDEPEEAVIDNDEEGQVDEPAEMSEPSMAPVTDEPIVPTTGQAPSTSTEDLLDTSDLPPTELLADPNPLNVPTFEAEIFLKEGNERTITLEEAIELAYFNNQDLQVAILELEQAEAALTEARAAFLPTVITAADFTAQEAPEFVVSDDDDDIETSINGSVQATYDVFTSGLRSSTVRAAEEQVRFNELAVELAREDLRLATTDLYFDLQESEEQIRINQAFVDEADQNRRDNVLRQQAGVGTTFDVLRADVQLADAQQDLIQARAATKIAQRDLARLLNLPPDVDVDATPVGEPDRWQETYERWELTLEESILLAFQNRVELEQQLALRDLSLQQARATRATNRPQISLFANFLVDDILDDSSETYNFGIQFSKVLTDGGAIRAQARQFELSAEIAEENFSEAVDSVRFEVEQAYFTLRSNEENVITAAAAITQAAQALDLANLRLDAGVGTQLDVLSAQSELTEAEVNWVTAALGYNRALASLQRAVSNLRSTL